MRAKLLWLALMAAACLGLGLALAGCPAAHDGYPTTACMADSDCYRGESCSMNVCTRALDGGVD